MADQKNRLGFSIFYFFFESVRVREIGQSTTDSEKEGEKGYLVVLLHMS